jgi:hypothetical protein
MLVGNLPVRPVREVLQVLTLDESWNVFAPEPVRAQIELRATIDFTDGTQQIWHPPRATPLFALLTYHWDAWAGAAALGHPVAVQSIARWVAGSVGEEPAPVKVTLTRRWTDLEPPGSDRVLRWHESDLYVYDVPLPSGEIK